MEQDKKIIKRDINRSALCTLIFAICVSLIGPTIKLPYAKSVTMVLCAGLILFFNRKHLPEKWPITEKMPLANFLVALGIFGGYHALTSLNSTVPIFDMFPDTDSIIFMGLITPLAEEIVFRGVVLNRLKSHGILFGLIASTILFGVYHMNLIQLITASLLGMILGYVAMNYSIVYSFILHFFNNCILAICFTKICNTAGTSSIKTYVGLALFIVGLVCAIKIKVWEKIIQFFKNNFKKSEAGCYKAFFLNPIIIILLIVSVAITIILAIMVSNGAYLPPNMQ